MVMLMLHGGIRLSHIAVVRSLVSVLLGKHRGVGGIRLAHGIVGLDLLMLLLVIGACVAFVIPSFRMHTYTGLEK